MSGSTSSQYATLAKNSSILPVPYMFITSLIIIIGLTSNKITLNDAE
jgi:hypothetical protein